MVADNVDLVDFVRNLTRNNVDYVEEYAGMNGTGVGSFVRSGLNGSAGGVIGSISSAAGDPSNRHQGEINADLPWWASTIWGIVFGALIAVAVGGNLIVMWIVLAHRRMWTVTNYFLVNLSVSDFLLAVLNCSFNFVYMIRNDWTFGEGYCRFSNFVANLTVASSVFTLMATSFDRYVAIVTPLKPRMSRRKALIVIGLIWTSSCSLALPCLIYSVTLPYRRGESVHTACIMLWPDGISHGSLTDYVYNVIFLAVTYLIPMLAMVILYSIIARVLWGAAQIGEQNERHIQTLRSKRKVVRMFIVMVVLFALAWLPYHAYFIYVYHDFRITSYRYIQHIYLAFYWLAMSNAMVNPLVYYFLNDRFRNYFRRLICCCIESTTSREKRNHNDIPMRALGDHQVATTTRRATRRNSPDGICDARASRHVNQLHPPPQQSQRPPPA